MRFLITIFFVSIYSAANCQMTDTILKIGDKFEGGIIFFIENNKAHGLIAAPGNQTDLKVRWGGNGLVGARSLNDGKENTEKIIQFFSNDRELLKKTAAYICDTLTLGGFDDWYLPSINELQLVYDNQNLIGKFWAGDYCSSTEYNSTDALHIHFYPKRTKQFYYNKIDKDYYVRCIRKF